jgi:hypothetical protein
VSSIKTFPFVIVHIRTRTYVNSKASIKHHTNTHQNTQHTQNPKMSTGVKIALTLACLIWVIPPHLARFRRFLVNAYEVEVITASGVVCKNVLPGAWLEEEEDEVTEEVPGEVPEEVTEKVEIETTQQQVSFAFAIGEGMPLVLTYHRNAALPDGDRYQQAGTRKSRSGGRS